MVQDFQDFQDEQDFYACWFLIRKELQGSPGASVKLGADRGVAKVTPSWDCERLARIGSAQRTRPPVSAMCPGFGALFGTAH